MMGAKDIFKKILYFNPLVTKREGRFNYIGDLYRFDRRIFQVTILIVIALILFVFNAYNWDFSDKIYINCNVSSGCENPFYQQSTWSPLSQEDRARCKAEWCTQPRLPFGFETGTKPNWFYSNVGPICYTIFMLALLLNHFLYNKGKINKLIKKYKLDED